MSLLTYLSTLHLIPNINFHNGLGVRAGGDFTASGDTMGTLFGALICGASCGGDVAASPAVSCFGIADNAALKLARSSWALRLASSN